MFEWETNQSVVCPLPNLPQNRKSYRILPTFSVTMLKNILDDHQKIYTHTCTHAYIRTYIHTYNCIHTVCGPVRQFLVYIPLIADSVGNSSYVFSSPPISVRTSSALQPAPGIMCFNFYLFLCLPACGRVFVASAVVSGTCVCDPVYMIRKKSKVSNG